MKFLATAATPLLILSRLSSADNDNDSKSNNGLRGLEDFGRNEKIADVSMPMDISMSMKQTIELDAYSAEVVASVTLESSKSGGGKRSEKRSKTSKFNRKSPQKEIAFVARCLSDPLGELSPETCGPSADFNGDGILDLQDLKDIIAFSYTIHPTKDLAPLFPGILDAAEEYWPPYQSNDIDSFFIHDISEPTNHTGESPKANDECPGPDTYQLPWAPALCDRDGVRDDSPTDNSVSTHQLGQDIQAGKKDLGVPIWTKEHSQRKAQPTCGLGTSGRFSKGNKNQDPSRNWVNQYPYDPDFDLNLFETAGSLVWYATYFAGIPVFFGARGWTEAVAAWFHYTTGGGSPRQTDYEVAIQEDSNIKNAVDNEINQVLRAVKELHDGQEASFEFFSTSTHSVRSDAGGEYQAVLGGHLIWSSGTVTYDPDACLLQVDFTIKAEDFYDFGEWDGTFGDQFVNLIPGAFSALGWANGYITTGEIQRTETIDLQCCVDEDCGDATEFDCECNLCVTQCPTQQVSGGQGFQSFSVDLLKTQGTFEVFYEMYTVPDELNIYYQGVSVFSTGGLVSGSRTANVSYGSATSTSTTVTVEINAPISGTAWIVRVGCPP